MNTLFPLVRWFEMWSSGGATRWVALVLALALACGRSVHDGRDEGGPPAGEGGAAGSAPNGSTGGVSGTAGNGGSATASTGGTRASGGSATGGAVGTRGGAAGTLASGGSVGGTAGTPASGGSATGGTAGTPASGGSAAGGAAGEGGSEDVPNHDDFIIRSELMSAYEGLAVYGTFDQNFGPDSRSEARTAVIVNGAFELVWVEGFDRNSFGTYATLFVDRGSDARCTPDVDPAWVDFQSNITAPGSPEILSFDPVLEGTSNGPISCSEFDTWFGHDYRPPPE